MAVSRPGCRGWRHRRATRPGRAGREGRSRRAALAPWWSRGAKPGPARAQPAGAPAAPPPAPIRVRRRGGHGPTCRPAMRRPAGRTDRARASAGRGTVPDRGGRGSRPSADRPRRRGRRGQGGSRRVPHGRRARARRSWSPPPGRSGTRRDHGAAHRAAWPTPPCTAPPRSRSPAPCTPGDPGERASRAGGRRRRPGRRREGSRCPCEPHRRGRAAGATGRSWPGAHCRGSPVARHPRARRSADRWTPSSALRAREVQAVPANPYRQ